MSATQIEAAARTSAGPPTANRGVADPRPHTVLGLRSALVVGTGLIGTSVALALVRSGVRVHLADAVPDAARTAASLGAGTVDPPEDAVDLAIIAVPPAVVGTVLEDSQRRRVAAHYLDVASVKAQPCADVSALGCDTTRYIGSHPMAGREVSGPLGARADLFHGRPWVLTPCADTRTETLNAGLALLALCGAVPVVMDATAHDQAMALVSHAPHLLSSLLAARLTAARESTLRLSGQGMRDLTRIAAGNPALWADILSANAKDVADVLDELAVDLEQVVRSLRSLHTGDETERRTAYRALTDVLRRGRSGRARIAERPDLASSQSAD